MDRNEKELRVSNDALRGAVFGELRTTAGAATRKLLWKKAASNLTIPYRAERPCGE
jgi:hypothetical protein